MSVTSERLVLDFVDAGMACHEAGILPDALAELCVRADILAGDLLAEAMRLEWTPRADEKQNPHPRPIPKPDPKPSDPKPGK